MVIKEGNWTKINVSVLFYEYTRIGIKDSTIYFSLTMPPKLEKWLLPCAPIRGDRVLHVNLIGNLRRLFSILSGTNLIVYLIRRLHIKSTDRGVLIFLSNFSSNYTKHFYTTETDTSWER